ncbi:hypothetical protein FB561_7060 [Kribbella amoyensis]|uniref:Uncharacterized protein n=1 Tax=Kribbella amoyensis TaxID=996641 RepID=A0A561B2T6_9ACTN|nr:hypothetical protein [Kribbella amoyensis]TWD73175.1 hypothetical protein FB561_7060 [Kribbella amoyensis]
MTVKLNKPAFEHAKLLIDKRQTALDDRDDWSEHAPSTDRENDYLDKHGWDEYSQWYLGVDTEMDEETKGRYKFPYGDFQRIHRCGVISAESRAAQQDYDDITDAVAELHKRLDGSHA